MGTFEGHSFGVLSAVFSADGSSVLTASYDQTAKIWSVATGECTQTFSKPHLRRIISLEEETLNTARSAGSTNTTNTSPNNRTNPKAMPSRPLPRDCCVCSMGID